VYHVGLVSIDRAPDILDNVSIMWRVAYKKRAAHKFDMSCASAISTLRQRTLSRSSL